LIPIPNFLIILIILIIPAVAGAIGFGSAWQIQSWRADAHAKHSIEIAAAQERELHGLESKRQSQLAAAQSLATQRATKLRSEYAGARDTAERLRSDLTEANLRISSASADAVAEYALTANLVFDNCTRKYLEMAGSAQSHSIDVQVMQEGWPK